MEFPLLISATHTHKGNKPTQQDDSLIIDDIFPSCPGSHLYAVFDGHGSDGGKVSKFVKSEVSKMVLAPEFEKEFLDKPDEALKARFSAWQDAISEETSIDTYLSGTTVVMAIAWKNNLVVASVGDSRLIIGREENGQVVPVQITRDHTCENDTEKQRITDSGGRVEQLVVEDGPVGPLRIFKGSLPYPGLVVTRAIGDNVAKKLGVLYEPDIAHLTLTPSDKFIVLGTDGVFDGISNKEVVAIVSKFKKAKTACKEITKASLAGMNKANMDDNTTNICVIIDFNKERKDDRPATPQMTTTLFDKILEGKDFTEPVLVKDSVLQSGRALNRECISRSSNEKLILCLNECSLPFYNDLLKNREYAVVDCSQNSAELLSTGLTFNYEALYDNILHSMVSNGQHCIIFDSLNWFLLTSPLCSLSKFLQRLFTLKQSFPVRILALLHSDVIPCSTSGSSGFNTEKAIDTLFPHHLTVVNAKFLHEQEKRKSVEAQMAPSPAKFSQPFSLLDCQHPFEGACRIFVNKKSGKCVEEVFYYTLEGKDKRLVVSSQNNGNVGKVTENKSDPTKDLTFNLSLTDKQRKAKNEVELPYIKAQNTVNMDANGNIHYQMEEEDDFDEEDPDEDLDL